MIGDSECEQRQQSETGGILIVFFITLRKLSIVTIVRVLVLLIEMK
jgi:hypothetical protein